MPPEEISAFHFFLSPRGVSAQLRRLVAGCDAIVYRHVDREESVTSLPLHRTCIVLSDFGH